MNGDWSDYYHGDHCAGGNGSHFDGRGLRDDAGSGHCCPVNGYDGYAVAAAVLA